MAFSNYTKDGCSGSDNAEVNGRTFDHAGSIGSTGTWAANGGNGIWKISSNTIVRTGTGDNYAWDSDASGVGDMRVSFKLTAGRGGVMIRFSRNGSNQVTCYVMDNVPGVFALLRKFVDDTGSVIGTASAIASLNDVCALEIVGQDIRYLINGTPVTWAESGTTLLHDTTIATGGWGVKGEDWSAANFGFDDFLVETGASTPDANIGSSIGGVASSLTCDRTVPTFSCSIASALGGIASAATNSANPGGITTAPTKFFDANTIVAADGSEVTSWADRMGGAAATGSGFTYRASKYGGYPGVEADSAGSLAITGVFPAPVGGMTIFVVARNRSIHTFLLGKGGDGSDFGIGNNTDSSLQAILGGKESGDGSATLRMLPLATVEDVTYSAAEVKYRQSRNSISTETTPTGGDLTIGAGNLLLGGLGTSLILPPKCLYHAVLYYDTPLSAADRALVYADLNTRYGFASQYHVCWEGDSLSDVSGSSLAPLHTLPLLTKTYGLFRCNARGGSVITGGAGNDLETRLSANAAFVDASRGRNIYVVRIGTNDLNDLNNANTFMSNLNTHLAAVQAAGFTDIIVTTILSRSASFSTCPDKATWDTLRATVNTAIRALVGTGIVRACADIAADPVIGTDAAGSNAAIFPDGVHIASAYARDYEAPLFAAALDSIPVPGIGSGDRSAFAVSAFLPSAFERSHYKERI